MKLEQPLRCTAFEELMLSQDSPAYPCVIVCKMQVRGRIERHHFAEAVRQMLLRHPLLRARLQTRWGRCSWKILEDPDCEIVWTGGRTDEAWTDDFFLDLAKGAGLRIFCHEAGEYTTVLYQAHHAIVDGLGLHSATHEKWQIYDALAKNKLPNLPLLSIEELKNRNRFGLGWRKMLELAPRQLVGLKGVWQFLMRSPKPLVNKAAYLGERKPSLTVDVISHSFDAASSVALRATALARKVAINDLLASCVFTGCTLSRPMNDSVADADWLRMMVPVNLRRSLDSRQTACNIVSSVFLDRTPEQIRDREWLLASIHKEMNLIKTNQLALMFIFSLWMWQFLPRRKRATKSNSKCRASIVFTNLGKPYTHSPLMGPHGRIVAGDLSIEDVQGVAPLAPYLSVSISAIHYARKLTLSLRFDSRELDNNAAKKLLESIVSTAHLYIDVGPLVEKEQTTSANLPVVKS